MLKHSDLTFLCNKLTFFKELSPSQQTLLLQHAAKSSCKKGTILHTSDLDCAGLLLILKGTLRASMLSDEGKEITLYRVNEGEVCVLSAACVLKTITFAVSIDAVADCELIQVDSSFFSSLMQQNIYAEAFAYKLATKRFSDVMWVMQQILFMSFDKRLALFLLEETGRTGSDHLKMTHEEIAKYTGSAREVVTRMLKYFSGEGLVKLSRGEIQILDRIKLSAVS